MTAQTTAQMTAHAVPHASEPIVVEGPGPLAWTAAIVFTLLAGAVVTVAVAWMVMGAPLPSRWPDRGRLRWLRAVWAVVLVTWDRANRLVHRHRPESEQPTVQLPVRTSKRSPR